MTTVSSSGDNKGGHLTDGLLLVDKPVGLSSHDVVLIVRRAYGEKSIGHLGTLDPFATGLLVLLLGRCTRLATFIDNEPKIYEATIRFGSSTDTDDLTGRTIHTSEKLPSLDEIRRGIDTLTGTISQLPPAYSAKKVDGQRAYEAAREGKTLDLKPVNITVHSWEILNAAYLPLDNYVSSEHGKSATVISEPVSELTVRITCGGGTYIRALARDLGESTGTRAHLTSLRRTGSGEFKVEDAAPIERIKMGEDLPPVQPLKVVTGP